MTYLLAFKFIMALLLWKAINYHIFQSKSNRTSSRQTLKSQPVKLDMNVNAILVLLKKSGYFISLFWLTSLSFRTIVQIAATFRQ